MISLQSTNPDKSGTRRTIKQTYMDSPGKGKQTGSLSILEALWGDDEGNGEKMAKVKEHGGGEHEGTGWSSWGRTERQSKERDNLKEAAIMGLAGNLSLLKNPGIHKNDPS